MKQKIARIWVDALRSGEYKQVGGRLKTLEGYCCLGVLCDLAVDRGIIPAPILNVNSGLNLSVFTFGKQKLFLPSEVMEWAGVNSSTGDIPLSDPAVPASFSTANLSKLNDSGVDFKTIAEVIERNVKTL